MNILEEVKFFSNTQEIGIGYPILLTILNLPSILFEIFPFIILISTQFFFIKFQDNNEILIFKNNGITNLKIIFYICFLVFLFGIILITIFHTISSKMKSNYLQFKNTYTEDNKYLAVVNENGLWIKDKLNNEIMIIHAENIEKNLLKDLVITTYDNEFNSKINIIAEEANIKNKIWEIKNVNLIDSTGKSEDISNFHFETNFDYLRINSLFSNLESLNIFELLKQKKDFESIGLNISDINLYLHKLFSLPISLMIFCLLSSVLMLNISLNKSKTFLLIIGILISVIIYYIFYFFGLLATNNKIPAYWAIWFPNLILFLSCMVGIVNINEK
tara:strand:+ start:2234 stop:3226 length:993 start_codon:yes stop_codon:yes gene_type:complete